MATLTRKEADQLNASEAAIKASWLRACSADEILHSSKFVVFSQANVAAVEHNNLMLAHTKLVNRIKRSIARRERHRAMKDLGLKRVTGNLGGVYYE